MIISRSHIPWALGVAVLTGLAGLAYVANYHPAALPLPHLPAMFGPVPPLRRTYGGTPLGLIFGIVSYAIFLIAAGLGIRKKRRTWPIGHVQTWMRAHIWLTILTIPLILLHCGFHFGGFMTSALMVLYFVVMISGFYGLAMQQFIPRIMTQTLAREVVYEQIPHVRKMLLAAAEALWKELAPGDRKETLASLAAPVGPNTSAHAPAFKGNSAELDAMAKDEEDRRTIANFLHKECFPYLRSSPSARSLLREQRRAEEAFRILRLNVTVSWQDRVDQMEQWCTDRRLIDRQARMQHWLHWWLLVHVPLSFALIVVTLWHAYVTVIFL